MGYLAFVREVGLLKWAVRFSIRQFQKRVLRKNMTMVLPTGSRMFLPPDSPNSSEIYITGSNIDWGAEKLFSQFADSNRDFLDIGAHIGYYSMYLSPKVRDVYAFEPDIRNLEVLNANANLRTNIKVCEMAVSSYDGIGAFDMGDATSTSKLADGESASAVRVRITRVDTFVSQNSNIDIALIKIDAEGHDFKILQGSQATVRSFQPLIVTECEPSKELAELCSSWKYDIFAHVRDRKTLATRFQRMSERSFDGAWCKMLFLVPERLSKEFAALPPF